MFLAVIKMTLFRCMRIRIISLLFPGRHFYYNMSAEMECTQDKLLTWFPLLDQASDANQLIGIGFMGFLQLPASALVRDYFERPTEANVRVSIQL